MMAAEEATVWATLAQEGYTHTSLRTAWRDTTNVEMPPASSDSYDSVRWAVR